MGQQALSVYRLPTTKEMPIHLDRATNWNGTLKSAQTFMPRTLSGWRTHHDHRDVEREFHQLLPPLQFEYTNVDPTNRLIRRAQLRASARH